MAYRRTVVYLLLPVLLLSCTRQELEGGGRKVSLHLENPEVKTALSEDRTHLLWQAGDRVRVFNDADGSFDEAEYGKDPVISVTVPSGAASVKAVYPPCDGSYESPAFVFGTEQIQPEAGVFPGKYYPLCADARIESGEASLSFTPVGAAFALNVYNPLTPGEKLLGITLQASQMSEAIATRLGKAEPIAADKPQSKRMFQGQVYSCFPKGKYSNVKFLVDTDIRTYCITSNDTEIDCSSFDFQVLNLNLANFSVCLCTGATNESFSTVDITDERACGISDPEVIEDERQLSDDTIPDFSRVGYMWGEKAFPTSLGEFTTVVEFPSPGGGDDTAAIQEAIDKASFGTVIHFPPMEYRIEGIISLNRSGVVLQGSVGPAGEPLTTFRAAGGTEKDIRDLLVIGTAIVSGSNYYTTTNCALSADEDHDDAYQVAKRTVRSYSVKVGAGTAIIGDAYCGSFFVTVLDPQLFSPGSRVRIYRPATNVWLDSIHMREIRQAPGDKGSITQWSSSEYGLHWDRIVTHIKGNRIYFDNPLVMRLDELYGRGYLQLVETERIRQSGVENIVFVSDHNEDKLDSDNNHAFNAVTVKAAEHCWVHNIDSWYFAQSCVDLASGAQYITVSDCRQHQPCGQIKGGLRYAFHLSGGSMCLVSGCTADRDRHGFVAGARVGGPNVFNRCRGTNMKNVVGPHQRWATGILYDHVSTNQNIVVQDAGNFGTGHGWQGANIVLWSCEAAAIICQSPWASAYNYAIGCNPGQNSAGRGYPSSDVLGVRPDGVWRERNVGEPEYLYESGLSSRLLRGELLSDKIL